MSSRERFLRAAFIPAWEARGTDRCREAVEEFVRLYDLWPLIEFRQAVRDARAAVLEEACQAAQVWEQKAEAA